MKNYNIVKRLEKEGYNITYQKWEYWDNIPHVQFEGFDFAIVEFTSYNNTLGCKVDFVYNEVLHALYIAQKNNPVFLKKIEKEPEEKWYYSRFLIRDMGDYYRYKKDLPPFDGYYNILKKLKKEF